MSFKKLVCVALAASLPVLANAATFEKEMLGLGSNDSVLEAQNLGVLGLSGISLFGARLDALPGANSADFFQFSLSSNATVSFAVNTYGGPSYTSDPIVGLYNSLGTQIGYDDDGGAIYGAGYDAFLSQALVAGTYYVAVSGYNDSAFTSKVSSMVPEGKNFAYELAINIAPVPEPESYAMLLAGLGLIGAIARRRRSSK